MIRKVAEGIKVYESDLHEFTKDIRMYQELYGKDISKYTESNYNLLNMENERLLGMERVLRLSVEESLEFRQKEGIYSFDIVDIISR